MSFASLGLSAAILKAVEKQGYDTPSAIQEQAIPAVLEGKDVMAAAQTGTGKTAGFTLPLLELLSKGQRAKRGQVRALVLTPTRELAAQVAESVSTYGANLPLKSAVVFGGVSINPQITTLRNGVDILVATPGRLLDLCQQKALSFSQLEVLILDEADRMLDMGFIRDIKKVLAMLPKQRQNLMFSATFSDEIRELAKGLVNNPVEISVTPRNATANTVEQSVYAVDKSRKARILTKLIKENNWHQVLVFSRTKHGANRLAKNLDADGINAVAIHGNKSQGARTKALADFKAGKAQVMVATDIAARGIDIDQLPFVVNFDLPNVPEDYVHRIGRTGRAGATGLAVSLVSDEEVKLLHDIERLIKRTVERKVIEGYEACHDLPEASLKGGHRAANHKKPNPNRRKHANQADGQKQGQSTKQGQRPAPKGNSDKPSQRQRARARAEAENAQSDGNKKPQNRRQGRTDNSSSQGKVDPYANARR
ncbi:DEAD/DEAH box helicase [Shewanella sp. 1_MG-2023]|uniref:DEAD/DEAH box helicase n=1 Tax=unclassified Shewanella TaxID=196818 RepID=UPI000C835532|nr:MULTISPECIES: DEAD/DEAH box helicase [unclassified Shewanella]MCC4834495.1 DEAD/DEAH box helicase [Shewanella sp. 10N.7]MDO6611520.1 DEAD/DEAH box helicase [Shewanella sp. 7_MG-2023]MDO6771375.1 DEAD/DEAH box helicase [Shewanella sp. 2_MG-2023]MDO6793601.1 DEAD/DEAH box helicase [Shewanella sp. 1_MG-2023]PMG79805.1 ATP-dependent RNA helicase [Shewanella sp. 10N.286.51.B7]